MIAPASEDAWLGEIVDACLKLLQEPDILSGDYDIHWLENWAKRQSGQG